MGDQSAKSGFAQPRWSGQEPWAYKTALVNDEVPEPSRPSQVPFSFVLQLYEKPEEEGKKSLGRIVHGGWMGLVAVAFLRLLSL